MPVNPYYFFQRRCNESTNFILCFFPNEMYLANSFTQSHFSFCSSQQSHITSFKLSPILILNQHLFNIFPNLCQHFLNTFPTLFQDLTYSFPTAFLQLYQLFLKASLTLSKAQPQHFQISISIASQSCNFMLVFFTFAFFMLDHDILAHCASYKCMNMGIFSFFQWEISINR